MRRSPTEPRRDAGSTALATLKVMSPFAAEAAGIPGVSVDEMCSVCGSGGRLLLCARCPLAFHLTCINPPLDKDPDEMWCCRRCSTPPGFGDLQSKNEKSGLPALFHHIAMHAKGANPIVYVLPPSLSQIYANESSNSDWLRCVNCGKLRRVKEGLLSECLLSDWNCSQPYWQAGTISCSKHEDRSSLTVREAFRLRRVTREVDFLEFFGPNDLPPLVVQADGGCKPLPERKKKRELLIAKVKNEKQSTVKEAAEYCVSKDDFREFLPKLNIDSFMEQQSIRLGTLNAALFPANPQTRGALQTVMPDPAVSKRQQIKRTPKTRPSSEGGAGTVARSEKAHQEGKEEDTEIVVVSSSNACRGTPTAPKQSRSSNLATSRSTPSGTRKPGPAPQPTKRARPKAQQKSFDASADSNRNSAPANRTSACSDIRTTFPAERTMEPAEMGAGRDAFEQAEQRETLMSSLTSQANSGNAASRARAALPDRFGDRRAVNLGDKRSDSESASAREERSPKRRVAALPPPVRTSAGTGFQEWGADEEVGAGRLYERHGHLNVGPGVFQAGMNHDVREPETIGVQRQYQIQYGYHPMRAVPHHEVPAWQDRVPPLMYPDSMAEAGGTVRQHRYKAPGHGLSVAAEHNMMRGGAPTDSDVRRERSFDAGRHEASARAPPPRSHHPRHDQNANGRQPSSSPSANGAECRRTGGIGEHSAGVAGGARDIQPLVAMIATYNLEPEAEDFLVELALDKDKDLLILFDSFSSQPDRFKRHALRLLLNRRPDLSGKT